MTFQEKVELAKVALPVLALCLACAVVALGVVVLKLRHLERTLRGLSYEARKLRELVGAYERIDELHEQTIAAMRRQTPRR
jgi:hypothetical protein